MDNVLNEKDTQNVIISGEVCDITYQNEENGYAVFDVETGDDFVTVTGIVPSLFVGEKIKIHGIWTEHATYGKQLKIISFEKEMPQDASSMLKYLASGAIKGIGPKTAGRIIERFGESSFEILESAPDLLCEIKGISPKKAQEISASFNAQFGMRRVMMFFSQFFGPTLSAKIYKKWGSAAIDIVQSNCYILCDEIQGIGFEKADSIGTSLGTPKDSPERIRSGIKYILNFNAYNNGHTYLPKNKLIKASAKLLDVEENKIESCIDSLNLTGDIILSDSQEQKAVSLASFYHSELYAAKKLCNIASFKTDVGFANVDALIEEIEISDNIKYSSEQKRAIRDAMFNSLYVLTGGPGTGKTTIIRAIIKIFNNLGLSFVLAAPTGRAAKRMTESTLHEAKTIHRLLEYEFRHDDEETSFARNDANPLMCDAVIVDECSMIDLPLFSALVRAIRPSTRLILIGDYNQLPSVGPGNILKDIIESGCFNVGNLTEIYRQGEGSSIVLSAHRINTGKMPDLSNKNLDFFFMNRINAQMVVSTVTELVEKRLPAKYGDKISQHLQILCAMKKGALGTKNMNEILQELKNPESFGKAQIKVRDTIIRVGDKVIQTRNNYQLTWKKETIFGTTEEGQGIFNGDIGYVTEIDTSDNRVWVDYDSKIASYDVAALDDLELAYAITIHKSQGSEYPVVILPLLNNSPLLMTRNLLYTAITRAKKMVIIVGDRESVERMVNNAASKRRYTKFIEILKEYHENN